MRPVRHLLRRAAPATPDLTFCESCGQACDPACRATEHLRRQRDAALRFTLPR